MSPAHHAATVDDGYFARPPLRVQIAMLAAVVLPFLGFLAAIVLLWGTAFDWMYLALFVGMYTLTAMGITVGYHRLLTHRAFTAPKPVLAFVAIAGSMAAQGPILYWVATHRRHHQHSDDHGDPHSPHLHGDTIAGALKGMVHAHVAWLFRTDHSKLSRYVGDLTRDPFVCRLSRLFPLWVALGLVLPAVFTGLLTMSWKGALLGFLWGGLARMCFCHHVTWSINSVCHIWGSQPFNNGDESRNNPVFGVLAFGEGWHNNHHAFPTSARHGLSWWQLDISYVFIRALEAVGLASNVRVPTDERLEAKKVAAKRAG
jgi:stearoyl-CoA desaturase (delta-9 desaturase)